MKPLGTYTIERKGDQCAVIAEDGTPFLSLNPQSRPLWNLIIVSSIGVFGFILMSLPAFFLWAFLFDPEGPTSLWHGFATITTAIFAGIFVGSLALRRPTYNVRSEGRELDLCADRGAFRLSNADGTTLATLQTGKNVLRRRQWQANNASDTVVYVATETSILPRPIRIALRFFLSILLLIGLFAGLYFVLVVVLGVGLGLALLVTQAGTVCLLWVTGLSNNLESTVRVCVGELMVAEIANKFGRTTLHLHEVPNENDPQSTLLASLLAILVYA